MSSVWFDSSDEEEVFDDGSNSFYGIFNQDPLVIAKNLPRPKTPFTPQASYEAPVSKGEESEYSLAFGSSSPPSVPSFSFNGGFELSNLY